MQEHDPYIATLIELHSGLERQGPGDVEFSRQILQQIPELPPRPRIADLGCGAGAGALMLAASFRSRVRAVDISREFLDQLAERAKQLGLDPLIEIIEGDFGRLDWEPGSVDLLWSEGAAYILTFAGALEAWRPLLADGGIAVITEMNYFSDQTSAAVTRFMQQAYPTIQTEEANIALIESSGFELLGVQRLPSSAWWKNYYGPLNERIETLKPGAGEELLLIISETEQEMELFRAYADEYGYTCYLMRKH